MLKLFFVVVATLRFFMFNFAILFFVTHVLVSVGNRSYLGTLDLITTNTAGSFQMGPTTVDILGTWEYFSQEVAPSPSEIVAPKTGILKPNRVNVEGVQPSRQNNMLPICCNFTILFCDSCSGFSCE